MADKKKDIRRRLKEARTVLDLESQVFAEKAGIDKKNYSSIETSERSVGDRVLRDITKAHGINLKWLMTGEGEMFDEKMASFDISSEDFKEKVSDRFAEWVLELIQKGEIYPSHIIEDYKTKINELEKQINELQRCIGKLEAENNSLRKK